ncbi:basic salivary proline-rich protein 2-like [Dipodomys spectabilis]|uniref:basic salivary proline-rich protein 2-like n=1 Tax=Dipodomys spectabilis TaxID=105255 RepID=UPI001C54B038|nr:basic salivary proline-rich protein 2-like [Dipodomys spectabilis]
MTRYKAPVLSTHHKSAAVGCCVFVMESSHGGLHGTLPSPAHSALGTPRDPAGVSAPGKPWDPRRSQPLGKPQDSQPWGRRGIPRRSQPLGKPQDSQPWGHRWIPRRSQPLGNRGILQRSQPLEKLQDSQPWGNRGILQRSQPLEKLQDSQPWGNRGILQRSQPLEKLQDSQPWGNRGILQRSQPRENRRIPQRSQPPGNRGIPRRSQPLGKPQDSQPWGHRWIPQGSQPQGETVGSTEVSALGTPQDPAEVSVPGKLQIPAAVSVPGKRQDPAEVSAPGKPQDSQPWGRLGGLSPRETVGSRGDPRSTVKTQSTEKHSPMNSRLGRDRIRFPTVETHKAPAPLTSARSSADTELAAGCRSRLRLTRLPAGAAQEGFQPSALSAILSCGGARGLSSGPGGDGADGQAEPSWPREPGRPGPEHGFSCSGKAPATPPPGFLSTSKQDTAASCEARPGHGPRAIAVHLQH